MNSSDNNSDDDSHLFREIFGDIERIHSDRQNPPVTPKKPMSSTGKSQPEVTFEDRLLAYPQVDNSVNAPREYQAGGLQNKQMDKLRRGKIRPEAILDLHGMTREVALQELQIFIQEARQQQLRCIQIVHGKGYRSESGKAILKPAVSQWLIQMASVMAFCPALPRDGGDGAVYVLLKKLKPD